MGSGSESHADDTGALQGRAEHLLMVQAGAGDAAGEDAAFFGLETAELFPVLEVDVVHVILAESADLRLVGATL